MFEIMLSELSEINTNMFGVFSEKVIPPARYVCKINEKKFSRFFYVISGEIIFNKGKADELRAPVGSIVYLPNNITYESEWNILENGEYISLNFILDEFYLKLPDELCIAVTDKTKRYLNMFVELYNTWKNGSLGYKLQTLSLLYKILYNLFSDSACKSIKTKHNEIYKGILYIENNYLEDIDVKMLADMCNVSESSFRRLFKEYKKMPPVTYKNYLRIKKAGELLQTGEYNVTEAALAVNISDISYFHKLFKKFFGVSPRVKYCNHEL